MSTEIKIPEARLRKIERMLEQVIKPEQINEEEASRLLGVSKKTIMNYVISGKIPADYYTVGIGGNRFYFKDKLMGTKPCAI